jgi:hypothetical protein
MLMKQQVSRARSSCCSTHVIGLFPQRSIPRLCATQVKKFMGFDHSMATDRTDYFAP